MSKEQKKRLKESWTSPTFLRSRCKLDPSMFLPSNSAFTLAINISIFLVLYKLHSVNGPIGLFFICECSVEKGVVFLPEVEKLEPLSNNKPMPG